MSAILDARQADRARRLGSALRGLAHDLTEARREIICLEGENQALRQELGKKATATAGGQPADEPSIDC